MGASAGVVATDVPKDIREIMSVIERQKKSIAEHDGEVIKNEMLRVFKKHGTIISVITSRSKAQLKLLFHSAPNNPDEIYKLIGSSNTYALFMKMLFMSKAEIEFSLYSESKKGDYDEDMLVDILGTSNNHEIQNFCHVYEENKKTPLVALVESKIPKGSSLQNVMLRILATHREETLQVDADLVARQAKDLHKAGAARLVGVDEDVFFDILLKSSRAQCVAIAEEYQNTYSMTLERAVNMKFKGNCAKLLIMSSYALPTAVCTQLNALHSRMIIDKVATVSVLAKYDKDFLVHVGKASEALYGKSLNVLVHRGLSGNLLKSVEGWIDNPTPDKGYERILENYLDFKRQEGYKMAHILHDETNQQRCRMLLEKETAELQRFMKDHKIELIAGDVNIDTLAAFARGKTILHVVDSFVTFQKEHPEQAKALNKYSMRSEESVEYDAKAKSVFGYLRYHFEKYDADGDGYYDVDQFWAVLKLLPLQELGFTEAEIDTMREWCEWDKDGVVQYEETYSELTDSVINAIDSMQAENPGAKGVLELIKDLSALETSEKKVEILRNRTTKAIRRRSVSTTNTVSLALIQYLYDTIAAFDMDGTNKLSKEDLDSFLGVLSIPELTSADFALSDNNEWFAPKDIVECITVHLHSWADDGLDHYLCLVDRGSGAYFWFNTRDESSQWAEYDEEVVPIVDETNAGDEAQATTTTIAAAAPTTAGAGGETAVSTKTITRQSIRNPASMKVAAAAATTAATALSPVTTLENGVVVAHPNTAPPEGDNIKQALAEVDAIFAEELKALTSSMKSKLADAVSSSKAGVHGVVSSSKKGMQELRSPLRQPSGLHGVSSALASEPKFRKSFIEGQIVEDGDDADTKDCLPDVPVTVTIGSTQGSSQATPKTSPRAPPAQDEKGIVSSGSAKVSPRAGSGSAPLSSKE